MHIGAKQRRVVDNKRGIVLIKGSNFATQSSSTGRRGKVKKRKRGLTPNLRNAQIRQNCSNQQKQE
jgi:hypothetical protein